VLFSVYKTREVRILAAKDWALLRRAIIDELEAINYYEDFMAQMEDQEAVQVLGHINNEEKEHVAELMELLRKQDQAQADVLKKELHL
jgi:hypothetical protein